MNEIMKDEMTYIDDEQLLRRRWQSLNDRFDRLSHELNAAKLCKVESSRRRLMRQQMMIAPVSLIGIIILYPISRDAALPMWLYVCYILFYVIMSINSFLLIRKIKSLSLSEQTVAEALAKVYDIIRFRRRSQILGIAMAFPLVAVLLWFFRYISISIFYGGLCGLVIGCALGLKADRDARRWLRGMKNELQGIADSEP